MTAGDYRRDLDDALHSFDLVRRRSRERKAALDEQLPTVSCTATSSDGAATVSVNADGLLTSLSLGPVATSLTPAVLARQILSAYDTAQRRSAQEATELLAPIFGDQGSPLARFRSRLESPPFDNPVADTGATPGSPLRTSAGDPYGDEFDINTLRG